MKLLSSLRSRIDASTGNMINYRPVYEHKGSTLSADSGYLYTDDLNREFFDAYGNVVITQPDGTIIYAQKLNYAAETQLAVLTTNVRMVDGSSTLTTNNLTYNMRGGIGTYTGGGRIVNQADTITSRNAWYFNQTKDAYFRHDVIVRTPDVQIFTDTMRYNSIEKTTYFYGPTNLKGKNGENLYTEEGYYNTETELAEFYKNNLYTETTRFLKGDTLYYDGNQGIGRALNNVLFIDTADQFFLEGMKGHYNRTEESILMTDRALVTIVLDEEEESTDSLAMEAPNEPTVKKDSVYLTADTLFSQMILLRDYQPMDFKLDREGGELEAESTDFSDGEFDETGELPQDTLASRDSIALDSVVMDSIQSEPPISADTAIRTTQPPDTVAASKIESDLAADSVLRQQILIPTGVEADSLLNQAILATQRSEPTDSLARDTLISDTTKTRIIKAYRNVRLFKSDLQSVADSAYYGYPDSMLRFFGNPMAWTQGSQMSGDSLYLQIKNEKIDNMLLLGSAFIVNTKLDSSKYNQVKGRKITGFFTNGDLERVFVDGNAESLAYRENKSGTAFTEMHHSRSSRIKLLFDNNSLTDFIPIRGTEATIYPIRILTQDQEILEGFIWKPGDRPLSKQDLLDRKRTTTEQIELPPDERDTNPDDDPDGDPVSDPEDLRQSDPF